MNRLRLGLIFLGIMAFQHAFCQTPVHGGIYSNTTWHLADSPFLMDGNIVVFPGVVLTIEPGVEVRVKENGYTGGQYSLEARGTINMTGSPDALIKFKANTNPTSNYEWAGILVKSSMGGVLNFDYVSISNALYAIRYDTFIPPLISLHRCEFNLNTNALSGDTNFEADSCTFYGNANSVYGSGIFTFKNCAFDNNQQALPLNASELTVENCLFKNNLAGINLGNLSMTGLSISNCTFENNSSAVLNANNGLIANCTFSNNVQGIIYITASEIRNSVFTGNQMALQAGWGTRVVDCEINNNETGVALGPLNVGQPAPVIENNRICYNTAYHIDNRTDLNLFIPTNCFCDSDSASIEGKILDGYDDITKGLISYAIFDTSCTNLLKTVYKQPYTGLAEESQANQSRIFPNPAQERLSIQNSGGYTRAEVVDMTGQTRITLPLTEGVNHESVSALPAGIYVVRMTGSGTPARNFRFIKQ
jgi:hypothetical protein